MITINYRADAAEEFYSPSSFNTIEGDFLIGRYISSDAPFEYWFRMLFKAADCLESGDICSISQPEYTDGYIRFQKNGDTVTVSEIYDCDETADFVEGDYKCTVEWSDTITFSGLKKEINDKCRMLLSDIASADARFTDGKAFKELSELLESHI